MRSKDWSKVPPQRLEVEAGMRTACQGELGEWDLSWGLLAPLLA